MKENRKRKTKPVTTGARGDSQKQSQDSVKITTREQREKKLRIDGAWNRSEALSEKFFGSSNSTLGKASAYVLFGFCYLFPAREKRKKHGEWLTAREKKLRERIHGLADSLPQLIYDKTTLMFILGALIVAGLSFSVTGNLLWLLFIMLGALCLIASTICLKYGIKGWFLAMILFLAMLGFFLEPKVISRGLPGLYKLFQMW